MPPLEIKVFALETKEDMTLVVEKNKLDIVMTMLSASLGNVLCFEPENKNVKICTNGFIIIKIIPIEPAQPGAGSA